MYPEIRKHAWLMHPLKVVQEGQKTPFSFWKNPRVPCFLKKKLLFIVRVQITTIDNRGHLIYISETSMSIMKYNDQTMKSEKGNMRLFPLHHSGSSLSWWSPVYQMKLPEAKEHSDLSLHARKYEEDKSFSACTSHIITTWTNLHWKPFIVPYLR